MIAVEASPAQLWALVFACLAFGTAIGWCLREAIRKPEPPELEELERSIRAVENLSPEDRKLLGEIVQRGLGGKRGP